MNFHVLTLFPEMIEQGLGTSITGRAMNKGLVSLHAVNIRDYAANKHKKVDDYTYGGGAGMLMQAQPVYDACMAVQESLEKPARVVYMTPQGSIFNQEKAKVLYDFLDRSEMFSGTVEKEIRSLMNVPFVTGDPELDAKFVKEAEAAGFVNLKGHRTVGGMRASIYNAMPLEGVEKLVAFMDDFERRNRK